MTLHLTLIKKVRFIKEPVGNGDYPALHRIVDTEKSGLNTEVCIVTSEYAQRIADGLNAQEDAS